MICISSLPSCTTQTASTRATILTTADGSQQSSEHIGSVVFCHQLTVPLYMNLFYYSTLWLYQLLLRLAAGLGHAKAQHWVEGRHGWQNQLVAWRQQHPAPVVWMHCASLGEFEQGRPLLEQLRRHHPDHLLLLSFFSPSGYLPLRHTTLADHVIYLPMDTRGTAARFIKILQPNIAFFVKYEFWSGYLHALSHQGIPTYLIGALFRQEQIFFRWYGGFFRRMLACFTQIFVQNEASRQRLERIGYTHSTVVGDPRLDRVLAIKANAQAYPLMEAFAKGRQVVVAGSTWPPDEALLAALLETMPNLYLVVAPHEIHEEHLAALEHQFHPFGIQRYTVCREGQTALLDTTRVLLVDTIGMLKTIYRYGEVAYIGGGLGAGLHNSLEAAVYEMPLLFGSNYHKFQEAVEFVAMGAATVVEDATTLRQATIAYLQPARQQAVAQQLAKYFRHHQGATTRIFTAIQPQLK